MIYTNRNNDRKNNLQNLSSQSSENYLFSEKFLSKNLNEKNKLKKSNDTPSKISIIIKPNRTNSINKHQLDLVQKNKYNHEHLSKKNTPSNEYKNLNEKGKNINKPTKQILSLNKRIKREKNTKINYLNIPKSKVVKNGDNKFNLVNSYSNKNFINIQENKELKNLIPNYSQGDIYKGLSFKENLKYDYLNDNDISKQIKVTNKKDKRKYIHNHNYTDIDLSPYNQINLNKNISSHEVLDNSKINKKEIYLNNPNKNEYIINTYIYNSPIEQHNIINNKNYISSKADNSFIKIKKNQNIEDKRIITSSPNKKIKEKNANNKNNKSKNFIPFDKIKVMQMNKSQYKKIPLKNDCSIDSLKRNEFDNNIRIKKNIFYYLNPNIYKDEISFHNIKKNARTTKTTLEENDLEDKSLKIHLSSNKVRISPKNISKERKNKKNLIGNLDEINEEKNNIKLNKRYHTQENIFNNQTKQIKNDYFDDDIQSICIINPRGNLNNNFIKISNMNKVLEYNTNKNLKMIISKTNSHKKSISYSSREEINLNKNDILNLKNIITKQNIIYPDNINNYLSQNIDIKNHKLTRKEIGIKNYNQKDNRYNENKKDQFQKNNKSIINISSNAPNTLFKSIKTGKNLSPSKLNKYKKEKEEETFYEKPHNNQSLKMKELNKNKSKEINKSISIKEEREKNKIINNKEYKNNNNFNIKEKNIDNCPNNISLEVNKIKDKTDKNQNKNKLINNYLENNVYDKKIKNLQYSNKKKNKKDIIKIKINTGELKLNNTKNNSKSKIDLNILEENKNQITIDLNKNNNIKINSPRSKIQNRKLMNKIYIKPCCQSPRNNNRPLKTERRLNEQTSLSRNRYCLINNYNHNYMKTSSNQLSISHKNLYPKTSPKLKTTKSAKYLKLKIKKDTYPSINFIDEDIINESIIKENISQKYCFIQKFTDYFLKRPLIYECYIGKIFKKRNISPINSYCFSNCRDEIDNNDIDFNKTISIKNLTFAENKKSIEKINTINKENNIKQKENLVEQIEILNDNFLDNEDIKLNYSDDNIAEVNSIKIYETTLGKEIEESEKKICKTYNLKNPNKSTNLENVEKGLNLLKNIAEKIELNSNDDSNDVKGYNNTSNKKNNLIYLGKKDFGINLTEGNNFEIEHKKIKKNRYSESLDKNLLVKGIAKIENIFERKSKSKIKTYQKSTKKLKMDINSKEEENTEKKLSKNSHIPINSDSKLAFLREQDIQINNINKIKNQSFDSSNLPLNKNVFKSDVLYYLNIISEGNYSHTLDKLAHCIIYKNESEINSNNEIINIKKNFKEIIFNKIFSENKFLKLYSKLIKDLAENISNKIKEMKNIKINKEGTLKFIIKEECISILNKFKNIPQEIDLYDYDSDDFKIYKQKMRNYVTFIYELINVGFLKQQFGINIIEQFNKICKEDYLNVVYKNLYLDICIFLFDKLMKEIIKENNKKLIQCLNNFIDDLSKIEHQDFQNYLRYKIINSTEKWTNLNKKENLELMKVQDLYDKALEEEMNNKTKINKFMNKNNNKEKKVDDYELIIQDDLLNYISYFTEKGDNNETIIKNEVDKSYNWKIIDDIINEKKFGLGYIIKIFIQACSNIITKESQVLLSNDYIKNIIEYYINNLSKEEKDKVQNEIIKLYQNINVIINSNQYMSKILGNLLFILIENKLYHIKDFNNYLKADENTQINLAIITKYCIISSGKFAKKYFNDFKQTKLFINNANIFDKYVYKALNDLFYFFK